MTIPFADSELGTHRPFSLRLHRSTSADRKLRDPVGLFTDTVAVRCGVTDAVPCATGSDADMLALVGAGVERGDAVVVSPFIPQHTIAALATLGVRPLFVDVDPGTIAIDPSLVLSTLEELCMEQICDDGLISLVTHGDGRRVAAVVAFHPFGQLADMKRLRPLARDFELPLIEIAGQAFGVRERDAGELRPAGAWGDLAALSFDGSASLVGPGDAGMVVARDSDWHRRLMSARTQIPIERRYLSLELRQSFDPFVAEVLLSRLSAYDQTLMRRRSLAGAYRHILAPLADEQQLFFVDPQPEAHGYQRFVVRVPHRDLLTRALARERIGHAIYYPTALSVRPGMSDLGYRRESCPQAERAARELIALPLHTALLPGDQDHVAQVIRSAL